MNNYKQIKTEENYTSLLKSGMFWEFHPELSGNWEKDKLIIQGKNIILFEKDESCEMAAVSLNDKCIMEGNYWDFHPGCHGINEYGDFNSPHKLVKAIQLKLLKEGKDVEIITKNYKYE